MQHCTGKARQSIECCAATQPGVGIISMIRARNILKERFGDEFVISESWVHKAANGPVNFDLVCSFRGRCKGRNLFVSSE